MGFKQTLWLSLGENTFRIGICPISYITHNSNLFSLLEHTIINCGDKLIEKKLQE